MKYTLKHRLIGAAVLAAVAVLFLPSFFKDKQAYPVSKKSQIPLRPSMVAEEFKAPEPVANIEPAPAPENMFVPDESVVEHTSVQAIPAESSPPVAPTQTVKVSSKSSAVSSAKSSAPVPTKYGAVQTSAVPTMPLNAQGLPEGWIVQVGSFSTKEAAVKIRDELQAEGQKAYLRTVSNDKGTSTRVFIGPVLDKAQAQSIKTQVDKHFKLNTIVKRFEH